MVNDHEEYSADERPMRSGFARMATIVAVTFCVSGAVVVGVGVASPRPDGPGCQYGPPGRAYGGPPGLEYGGPPGHQYGGPPGHQYGGPPGQQSGGPPGQQYNPC